MKGLKDMEPHEFWQEVHPAGSFDATGVHRTFFPVTLDSGHQLKLPIRPLAKTEHALASLIINQASFEVLALLADDLTRKIEEFDVDVVVGLPTLGLTLAAEVARRLGHCRYVPFGTSRKFWYLDELSVPMSSITTAQQKRLYIDPRMLPLLEGKRIALIDDVISSGASIIAGLKLLQNSNLKPVVIGAAMLQSDRWRETLSAVDPAFVEMTRSAFATPLLRKLEDGWSV
jgi:adenine/guanine phosphoribosyltransferase-like PRPP-binding protein